MSAERMAAERQQSGHRGDTGAVASARDSTGRAHAGPTVTVRVPIEFRQRRGRKALVAPDRAGQEHLTAPHSSMLTRNEVAPSVRALARAFRWRRLLETGVMATVQEIAAAENINPSYVSRVMRLTVLAPEIVEAIVKDSYQWGTSLHLLMQPFPVAWQHQLLSSYPIAL